MCNIGLPHFSKEKENEHARASVVMKVLTTTENVIEQDLIAKLEDLKYTHRPDIRDRSAVEKNFRENFETLNRTA